MSDEILSVAQAATIMDCTEKHVEDNLRSGYWAGIKGGKGWVIPRRAFFDRLNELAVEESAKRRAPPVKPTNVVPVPKSRRKPLINFETLGQVRAS